MPKIKKDPENYHLMSVPHEGDDAANKALESFYDELSELRKKYKMRDVFVIVYDSIKYEDGKVGEFMNCSAYGASVNQLPMTAFAYGSEKKNHDEMMAKMLSGKI